VIEDTGKKTINYIYDFGDNWKHTIKIGRITDPIPGELYRRLTVNKGMRGASALAPSPSV
jgi:hypothetical protein